MSKSPITNTVYGLRLEDYGDTATAKAMYNQWTVDKTSSVVREIAAAEAKRALDQQLPVDFRDFLFWLVENDPHIRDKYTAFMACKRIGVDV